MVNPVWTVLPLFTFYYPRHNQPRFQAILQTPLHLALFLAWTLVDGEARGTVSLKKLLNG